MPIVVDGVDIKGCDGVLADAVLMDVVLADTEEVYKKTCEFEGCIVFNTVGSHTWDVPENVISANVCVSGGGGSGAAADRNGYGGDTVGGGYAGGAIDTVLDLVGITTLPISIGAGGAYVEASDVSTIVGKPGAGSSAGSLSAGGGSGGSWAASGANPSYNGTGGSRTGCGGTVYTDGVRAYSVAGGGQASIFANGGNGVSSGAGAGNGSLGSGGGGAWDNGGDGSWMRSGAGGNGAVKIGNCTSNVLYTSDMSEAELLANGIRLNVGG